MNSKKYVVVSIHDVAPPQWEQVQRILQKLTEIGISRRSLLVIPNYQGNYRIDEHPELIEGLQHLEAHGDEIVLHGYEHIGLKAPRQIRDRIKNWWYTQGEGEFLTLEYASARERIALGKALLAKAALPASGFVAPSWLINRDGLKAAADAGFHFTNSYLTVKDLCRGRDHIVPSLVFGPGNLNEDLGVTLQRVLAKFLKPAPVVRVIIHPPCIDNAARFNSILSILQTDFAAREAITYSELMTVLRVEK